ncbi:hypothetical protein [Aquimarina sp. RZ0]|uniref:hypothetical protein n=1 Tax=Aquimarina sp. RZ0 TaxID=2607730 RepID=UPI00165F8765|nr:hypothetical protein [Aquimarina sp. RZ0]
MKEIRNIISRGKSYIKFLLSSTNQHGVHSPFVYNLTTKCFYDRTQKECYPLIKSVCRDYSVPFSYKKAKLLHRLISYLGYQKVYLQAKPIAAISKIVSIDNMVSISHSIESEDTFDLLYLDVDYFKTHHNALENLLLKTHNDSLIILNTINCSKRNDEIWEEIKEHPASRVTIHIFDLGLIFVRKEQAKEHFVIRV